MIAGFRGDRFVGLSTIAWLRPVHKYFRSVLRERATSTTSGQHLRQHKTRQPVRSWTENKREQRCMSSMCMPLGDGSTLSPVELSSTMTMSPVTGSTNMTAASSRQFTSHTTLRSWRKNGSSYGSRHGISVPVRFVCVGIFVICFAVLFLTKHTTHSQ